MSKVCGYIRVSSEHSRQSGLSPDAQRSALIDYHKRFLPNIPWAEDAHGSSNRGLFMDLAVSAWKGEKSRIHNRPAGSRMIDNLERGDHVLFYSIDRGFRNIGDFGNFVNAAEKNGWILHFVQEGLDTTTPSGKMRASIYAAMAEYYSSILSARLREAFAIRGKSRTTKKTRKIKPPNVDKLDPMLPVHRKPVEVKRDPGRVFLYARVSGQHQVESQLGIKSQHKLLPGYFEKLYKENDLLELAGMFTDSGVSAFKTAFRARPEGSKIFEQAKSGDHIVVLRFDRMFRSVRDMDRTIEALDKRGVILHMMDDNIRTDDKQSRIMLGLLGTIAQIESEMKSHKMLAIFDHMKKKSLVYNKTPVLNKIVVMDGKRYFTIDIELAVECYARALLMKEKNMSANESLMFIAAHKAQKAGEKYPLIKYQKMVQCRSKNQIMDTLAMVAEKCPPKTLDIIKTRAREFLKQPLSPQMEKSLRASYSKPNTVKNREMAMPF